MLLLMVGSIFSCQAGVPSEPIDSCEVCVAESSALSIQDIEAVHGLIRAMEGERRIAELCFTRMASLAMQIDEFGTSGWDMLEQEFSDPEYAIWLREMFTAGSGCEVHGIAFVCELVD